jgi:23S rRNA-/tRNA-specific pseudouridylate synthase
VPQTAGEFTVDAPIYKRSSGKMAAVRAGPDAEKLGAKAAVTRAKALATAKGLTLCELEITTGRQHQIRAHLSYVGCPVAGDAVYSDITDRGRAEGNYFHYHYSHPASSIAVAYRSFRPR